MKLNIEFAVNSLSFGNVGTNILRELWKRGADIALFPIGNFDIGAYDKINPEFKNWLEHAVNNRLQKWRQENPLLRLWHLDGSWTSVVAKKRALLTFYELDQPTPEEINTANNYDVAFLTSNYARDAFILNGADEEKLKFVPLGFDEDFGPTGKTYYGDDITHWVISGKMEARKNTQKIINLWAKKYGDNMKHRLCIATFNPFLGRNEQELNANNEGLIAQALEGKTYKNIPPPLKYLRTNSEVNDLLNSADIDLSGLSSGEGWNFGAFNSTCLGKWSVVLNAHAHKDWATAENSILVKPTGKRPAADGVFFRQGGPYNQGNLFNVADDSIIDGMERAEKVCKTKNEAGIQLGQKLTYKNTVDKLLEAINAP